MLSQSLVMSQEEGTLWGKKAKKIKTRKCTMFLIQKENVRVDIIYISMTAYRKLQYYVEEAKKLNSEVSGLGRIKTALYLGANVLVIDDIVILEQEGSAGFTEIDHKVISKFMVDVSKRKENIADWKVWWHTHTHSTFWSKTDQDTIEEKFGKTFVVALEVNNKDGSMIARIDVFNPFRYTVEVKNVKLMYDEDPNLRRKIAEEVKEKVKVATHVSTYIQYGNGTLGGDYGVGSKVGFVNHAKDCNCFYCKKERKEKV